MPMIYRIRYRRSYSFGLGARQLARKVPVIEVAGSCAQVRSEAEPADIWYQAPTRDPVQSTPYIRQISRDPSERDNVHGRLDGSTKPEEERHPDQVQSQLNRVQCCSLLIASRVGQLPRLPQHCGGCLTLAKSTFCGSKDLMPASQARYAP